MKDRTRWGLFVVCPLLALVAIVPIVRGINTRHDWARAEARWDKGEDHPAAVTITRQDGTPAGIQLSKTMSPEQIKADWCHCNIGGRGSFGRTIMRYPSVHDISTMYRWANESRQLVDNCASYPIRNTVRLESFQAASTTDVVSLRYAPDGTRLTFCFLAPEKLSQEDRVVLWSDLSPEGYP